MGAYVAQRLTPVECCDIVCFRAGFERGIGQSGVTRQNYKERVNSYVLIRRSNQTLNVMSTV